MCSIGKKLYIFGGYAKEPFNDTRVLVPQGENWIG